MGAAAGDRELEPGGLPRDEWSRTWGIRFRARERFARSLLIVPSLYMIGALVLGEWIPSIERHRDLLRAGLDPDSARTVLSSVAGGMIAFTGLVVSIAIVVVQFGASQYTPRLVNRFRRDPRVKHSLGIFIAPAIYALVALPHVGEHGRRTVPGLTVAVSLLLLVAAVIAFFLLVAGLLDLLRPRRVIGRIVVQTEVVIRQTYPAAMPTDDALSAAPALPVAQTISHSGPAAVVAGLDRGRLARMATAADTIVQVCVPVGGYVARAAPLLHLRGEPAVIDERALRRAVILAEERTITQDPAFAIRAIVDVALRALSPAVNDPTTAVQALDGLDSLLGDLAERDLHGHGVVVDRAGRVRLIYPTPTWPDLLELSLTEIRLYGVGTPQVPRRMRVLLERLLASAPAARHDTIRAQLRLLDAAIEAAYPSVDERALASKSDPLGIGGAMR